MKKELTILIVVVSLWCGLIVTTPVIASIEQSGSTIANGLYKVFGAVCHQFDSRSFHIYEHPFAVCIRCTAIYYGFLAVLISIRVSQRLQAKVFNITLLLAATCIPIVIDGVCSLFNIYQTTVFLRMTTGLLFGGGLALLLHKTLSEIIQSLFMMRKHKYEIETR